MTKRPNRCSSLPPGRHVPTRVRSSSTSLACPKANSHSKVGDMNNAQTLTLAISTQRGQRRVDCRIYFPQDARTTSGEAAIKAY